MNIPTGQWKDGVFDLFKAGPFHPSLWCACCCTQSEFGCYFCSLLELVLKVFKNLIPPILQYELQSVWGKLCNE